MSTGEFNPTLGNVIEAAANEVGGGLQGMSNLVALTQAWERDLGGLAPSEQYAIVQQRLKTGQFDQHMRRPANLEMALVNQWHERQSQAAKTLPSWAQGGGSHTYKGRPGSQG